MVATTAQQSTRTVMANAARLRRCQDGIWKVAKKAPMFNVVKVGSTGKEYTQYSRLINTQAYKVVTSGACAAVTAEMQIDMEHLGMDFEPDSKLRPWACSLSPGAAFMLEQFLSTIVQQIGYNAKTIREGIKKHQRNNKEVIKLAIDEVRESIFQASMDAPSGTTALPMSISRKGSSGDKKESKGEEEFTQGTVEEEEEDDGVTDEA